MIQLRFLHTTHTQYDLLNLSFLKEILKFSVFSSKIGKHSCQKKIVLYVVAFDPNQIQTCSALQNDGLNLSFVKNINVACEEMTRNGCEMAKIIGESGFWHIRL